MKKFLNMFFIVSFFVVITNLNSSASTEEIYLENLLNLSNVVICDSPEEVIGNRCLKMVDPIEVLEGEVYTLIISKDFYNSRSWEKEFINQLEAYIYFYNYQGKEIQGISPTLTYAFDYCFVTFQALTNKMKIHEIYIDELHITNRSSCLMLYKGEESLYNNEFVSYKSKLEPIQGYYIKNIDDNLTLEEILSSLKIESKTGEYELLILADNYTPNKDEIGEHLVSLMAVDKYYNRNRYDLTIHNLDITPPVIEGTNNYTLELKEEELEIFEIIKNLRVSDNHSNLIEQDLIIIEDSYSSNKNKKGQYKVVFKLLDMSLNETTFTVIINVVDTTPPIIRGPKEIYRYTTDSFLTEEEIKGMFEVYDNIDGNLNDRLEIIGTYEKIPGTYEFTLSVSDYSNNITTRILTLNVVEGSIPIFIADDLIIYYDEYSKMTREDMVLWLKSKTDNDITFKILLDETLYKQSKKEVMYVYYSYELNNQTHYGRIAVEPSINNYTNLILFSFLVVVDTLFIVVYIKKSKRTFYL